MKIIAKTTERQEFLYSRSSARSVPAASAKKILDVLNAVRYQLRDGEKWHIYDASDYEIEFSAAAFQRFRIRSGRVYDVRT